MMVFLVAMIVVSCSNGNNPIDEDDTNETIFLNCEPVFDDGNYFTNYEEILDTTGLKLYPFVPFTEEEWKYSSYFDYKLPRRQIPEDFLRSMSTKALFYQFVYTDLSSDMSLWTSKQYGFEAVTIRLNMLPELLNRPDAGHVLLELLQKLDPSILGSDLSDCTWWDYCLQIIGSQNEVINNMTNEDICGYIHHQLRYYDIRRSLDNYNIGSLSSLLFGLGNVMIRYEFEPFIQTLKRYPATNELIWDTQYINEPYASQVIEYVKQFIKAE